MRVVGLGWLFNESVAVIVFGVMVCAAGYAAIEATHTESKNRAIENARDHATKVVEAAEGRLALTIKNAELTLTHIAELNRVSPVCENANNGTDTLARVSDAFDVLGFVSILNQEGRVVCADVPVPPSSIGLDDRDYFQSLKDAAPGAIALGVPVLSRVSARWVLPVARRIVTSDGAAAIALTGIDLTVIVEGLEAQRPRPNGSVTLYLADKRLVARAPFDASLVGQTMDRAVLWQHYPQQKSGQYVADAIATDGVTRIVSFRQVDGYPLVLAVGVAKNDVLAEWKKGSDRDRLFMAAVAFAIMSFAIVLAIRLGTLRRMRYESRRLALVAENTGNMNRPGIVGGCLV